MSRQGCPGLTAAQLFGSSLAARQDHARCSSCTRLSPETGIKFGRRDKGWARLLAPLRTASVLEMRNADRRGGRAGGCRTRTGQLIGAVVTVLPEPVSVRPTSPANAHRTINSPPGGLAGGGAYLPRPQVPLELLFEAGFQSLGADGVLAGDADGVNAAPRRPERLREPSAGCAILARSLAYCVNGGYRAALSQ
jgi:hypothetical protein